jgi:peptide/nickel transport system ATP-binding protein
MNPLLPLLQINNLTVDFPGAESTSPALQDFSLELNRGEMLAVVGESGSGKTVMSLTLMNLLSGAARIRQGSILFSPDGREVVDLLRVPEKKFRSYRGNRLAMIFQEPMTSLNPVMTCGDQLCEPLIQHKKLSRSKAKAEAFLLLEKVQMPDRDRIYKSYPHQLSGGQKQRVMIAMAISCHPDILICDEPTTALDVRVQRNILDLLKYLRTSENIGMIFITHDLGLVADMADRALVMLKGRLVESGPVNEIFTNPGNPYTRGLIQCRPALHTKGRRLPVVSDFIESNRDAIKNLENQLKQTKPAIQSVRVQGNGPVLKASQSIVSEPELLVRVKDLSVRFSSGKNWLGRDKHGLDAIRDINFDVFRGETLGLVGESGSGKTTVGRALLGLNKPIRGTITYGGVNLLTMSKGELLNFRKNIQIVFQDPYSSLNPRLLVGNAIAEPIKVHESLGLAERKKRVFELLQNVDLNPEHFNRYPFEFSGGQRQRIVIARALALYPGFVVFDESVSALDVSVQAQVLNLINDLKKNLGFTAVFISHDLSVIRYLCDRVIVMEKGRIVESGDADTVYSNPQTEYTRSLIEAIPGKNLQKSPY